ncbi:unnamed protein product [Strongylus vulgaris]|uniref:Uncharacterized protein n=1 Tax=Strongylus vulgaris TaxID=40348 RepID=A0A3P7JW78_STRVU|nr:unnamed protein product [Strongylus vulgaris]
MHSPPRTRTHVRVYRKRLASGYSSRAQRSRRSSAFLFKLTFLVESVTHSVNRREPGRIDAHAGYYGDVSDESNNVSANIALSSDLSIYSLLFYANTFQKIVPSRQAVCFVAFMFGCLFTPSLLPVLSAKWALFLSSLCWTAYHASFFYLNSYLYYFSCTLIGFGFAYTKCQCASVDLEFSHHFQLILLFGLISTYLIFQRLSKKDKGQCHKLHFKRRGSKIARIYRQRYSADVWSIHEVMFSSFVNPNILLLSPLFFHIGIVTAFWIAVYPTTFLFTESLTVHNYLPAYYSAFAGIGEIGSAFCLSFGASCLCLIRKSVP